VLVRQGTKGFEKSTHRMNKIVSTLAPQQLEVKPIIAVETYQTPKLEEVRVDMAEMKIESRPIELLTSVGSCVAICVHDPIHKCGGLAHIMLPSSPDPSHEPLPSKFADTAVPALAKGIRRMTKRENRLYAKIAGGANMFSNLDNRSLNIGGINIRAVKAALEKEHIRLAAEDVGGIQGRRILFNVSSGLTIVRNHGGGIKKL